MKDKDFKNKLLLITYGVLLFVCLMNYQWVLSVLKVIWTLLLPFVIGIIIAFILNVLVRSLEAKLLKKVKIGQRVLSITMSLTLVVGFIVILLFILIPQVQNAGMIFLDNIPKYQENIYSLGQKLGLDEEKLAILNLADNDQLKNFITDLISANKEHIINFSMGFANSIFSAICNFVVGLVFAIYILLDKEKLLRQSQKLLKKIMNKKSYARLVNVFKLSNTTFSNFVKVQVLEAFILGLLCFLGMIILNIPYAATISVLVGFTALIPIFGAFIGCIIGAFLIFMINPLQSLIFIIFFIVLQQIEGNFIYPKVVGGKIGLPSIWVLVAVTLGGSIGGIFGMILGVPVVSVIYSLTKTYVHTTDSIETEN